MGLPHESEPLAKLRARYAAALAPIHDAESLMLGTVERPGQRRRHVFDFDCGYRLIVSRERMPTGVVRTHVSGYTRDESLESLMIVAKHWREVCQDDPSGLAFAGRTDGGIAHFYLEPPSPEVVEAMRQLGDRQ